MAGEERPATTEEIISAYAKQHKIPPALALSVAEQESGFDNKAVSGKGARGIFQLMPDTAKELGVDPDDPIQNIQGGIKYLKQLSDKYNGDVNKTLMAYNGGMGNVDRGTISPDAQVYATDVMRRLSTRMRTQATTPAPTSAGAVTTAAGAPVAAAGAPAPTPAGPVGGGGPGGRMSGAGPVGTTVNPSRPGEITATDMSDPLLKIGRAAAEGVDPRTSTGRENLAGMAGSLALGAVTGGAGSNAAGVLPWVVRVVGPAIGAATAGATEAAVEQAVGSTPPSSTAVTEAGLRQGGYELMGQAFMWPVRRVARSFAATRVGKAATTALEDAATTARRTASEAMDAVRTRVAEGIEAARALRDSTTATVREGGRRAVVTTQESAGKQTADVTTRAGQMVAGGKVRAGEILAQTELDNASAIADITKQYDNLLANPPSTLEGGQAVRAVVNGPAKRALDQAGQRVAEAAQTGPAIQMAPIKQALDDMAAKARPASIFGKTASTSTPAVAARPAGAPASNTVTMEEFRKMWAESLGVSETHPLPGLLGQVQAAPESLTFADAHKLKTLLDEGVNWDDVSKKHLAKITKGLRTVLRDAMSVHEPYNVATAAYQAVIPIYRKGIGKSIITAANTPGGADKIARTLSAKNPEQALALRDLLLTQSAAGGDPAAGQRAWDAVRSSFVYNKVLDGGIKDLSSRVHSIIEQNPEFAKAVFHDEAGQRIMSNLDRLGQAYTAALEQAQQRLAESKAAGTGLVTASKQFGKEEIAASEARGAASTESTRQAAADAIRKTRAEGTANIAATRKAGAADISTTKAAVRAGVDAAKAEQKRLGESSLKKGTITGQLADVIRATAQGPKSVWGALSIIRLLEGPQAKDLIEWAAYSDVNTQRLVSAITSQVPDRVAAGVLRDVINALQIKDHKHVEPVPPPARPVTTPARATVAAR
jgi:soluble lytic murein transglycosylase-like protein